jgi:hypothetical protein
MDGQALAISPLDFYDVHPARALASSSADVRHWDASAPDRRASILPGPRIMHGADAAPFLALRNKMETEWTPQLMARLGVDAGSLPIIWDADFRYGPRTPSGEDTHVLCEINVSSVFAIPDQAPAAIARRTVERIAGRKSPTMRNAIS